MNKLFVGGFPLDVNELDLARLIAPYGDIDTIKIVRDRKTKICKGYAFVEMHTHDGAINAMDALNDTAYGDRSLTLNIVEDKPAAPPRPKVYNRVERYTPDRYSPKPAAAPPSGTEGRPKRARRIV